MSKFLTKKEIGRNMKLTDKVEIVFENNERKTKTIDITINDLIDKDRDDIYDLLESTEPCTSGGCNTESQNFCDCGGQFDDFIIVGINLK